MEKSQPKITGKMKIFGVVFLVAIIVLQFTKYHWGEATIMLGDVPLRALVAQNAYQLEKGLGGRESLAPYEAMVFPFSTPARYAFIMRDMKFAIDIVWLNAGQVVDIAPNVAPEPGVTEGQLRRYLPRADATMVIELPAGWAQAHGLAIGDRLSLPES